VVTATTAALLNYMPSVRETWGGEGFGLRKQDAWTRLNNCGPDGKRLHPYFRGEPWLFGKAAWEPKPAPNQRYFGDRTPFKTIVDRLEETFRAGREGVVLPVLDDVPPLVVEADPEDFAKIVAALKARGHASPIIVNPHPFAAPSEPTQHQPPAADRIAALKARLAARAAGARA
jgi:hypothetical protein